LENCALTYLSGVQAEAADATCVLRREVLDSIIGKQATLHDAIKSGALKVTGDVRKLETLMSVMDTFSGTFELVEPIRH
jgi:alkyl sulfatase BDS1-like metallo-beta-lactamase superfamily hydrolase